MREIIYIAVAGGVGALGRYYVTELARRLLGDDFPYGTLIVNLVGSFLIGLAMQIFLNTDLVPPSLRLAFILGFLGAFTTFSAFSYATLAYIENGAWLMAGLNILGNVTVGIVAAFIGVMLGRAIVGGA